jgi:hypothetical protein
MNTPNNSNRLLHLALPPIEAECRFLDTLEERQTTLTIWANLPAIGMTLTVIQENPMETIAFDITGRGSTGRIEVADGETLTVICRHAGQVVGAGIYELDCRSSHLLVPRAVSNLLLECQPVATEAALHQDEPGDESGRRA